MKLLIAALVLNSSMAFAQAPSMPTIPAAPQGMPAAAPQGMPTDASGMMKKANEKATVHLNSASVEDLQKLPGIGPEKAKAIIAARPFKSVEDLKNVKGIKEGVFQKIKGMVSL